MKVFTNIFIHTRYIFNVHKDLSVSNCRLPTIGHGSMHRNISGSLLHSASQRDLGTCPTTISRMHWLLPPPSRDICWSRCSSVDLVTTSACSCITLLALHWSIICRQECFWGLRTHGKSLLRSIPGGNHFFNVGWILETLLQIYSDWFNGGKS